MILYVVPFIYFVRRHRDEEKSVANATGYEKDLVTSTI